VTQSGSLDAYIAAHAYRGKFRQDLRASDLPGTYELVDRVLANGNVQRRPKRLYRGHQGPIHRSLAEDRLKSIGSADRA